MRNLGVAKFGWVWLFVLGEFAGLGLEGRRLLQPAPIAAKAVPAPTTVPVARVNLQPILEFQPFGAAPVAPDPALAEDTSAPTQPTVPPRGLALQGVLLPGSGAARVLLSMDDGPAQSYGRGDLLPGGGTLAEIAADQIWIDVDGEKQLLGFVAPPASIPTAAPVAEDNAEAADSEPAGDTAEAPSVKPAVKMTSIPQPDLRHLIPVLTNAAVQKP